MRDFGAREVFGVIGAGHILIAAAILSFRLVLPDDFVADVWPLMQAHAQVLIASFFFLLGFSSTWLLCDLVAWVRSLRSSNG